MFYALKWSFLTVTLYVAAVILLWYYVGYADVTYDEITAPFIATPGSDLLNVDFCPIVSVNGKLQSSCQYLNNSTERIAVSGIMYCVAFTSLIGWVLFSIFGGVGLPSLPFDLLLDFKHRPKRIKLVEYVIQRESIEIISVRYTEKKKLIGEQAEMLLRASQALGEERKDIVKTGSTGRKMRKHRNMENEFKRVSLS